MSERNEVIKCDVLIIGCGIAGAIAALQLAQDEHLRIVIVTKAENALESNTYYAQGGIIYRSEDDSPKKLAADLIQAGDGLNNRRAVKILSTEGPRLVEELLIDKYHVPFAVDADGQLELTREAAHSCSRILHVDDITGRGIHEKLMEAVRAQPNIEVLTQHTVVDLLTPAHHSLDRLDIYEPLSCVGAYVFEEQSGQVFTVLAKATILATGGLGQIFLHTSNPVGATGDGLAMAQRAGARIINAEYVQFHPTTFFHRGRARFLVSESLRGEGAHLLNIKGEPFMHRYAPEGGDLAPRDEVARGIHLEMLRTGATFVHLDLASHMAADKIAERFPNIYRGCLEYGHDLSKEPIPVVPAAHYFCGGVWVDKWGHTNLARLYAIGEVSCTGLHGANRLGSSSLLEGLVWGVRAAADIQRHIGDWKITPAKNIPQWRVEGANEAADPALVEHDMATIKHTMWYYVGLVRSRRRLERALHDLNNLSQDVESFYRTTRLDAAIISLRNAVLAAIIVARAAWENRESHGCHFRED